MPNENQGNTDILIYIHFIHNLPLEYIYIYIVVWLVVYYGIFTNVGC